MIQGIHFIDVNAMTQHNPGVKTAVLDHLKEVFPVEVNGGLAVTDQSDTAFHQGPNVEVVRLPTLAPANCTQKESKGKTYETNIDTRDAATTETLDRGHHLVDNLGSIGLET